MFLASDAGRRKKKESVRRGGGLGVSDLPVKIKNKKLINRLYPTYNTPLVMLPNDNLLIQYNSAFAKTYPALAPAVLNARHCQW